jgi:uncharacterized protein YqgV (UPF0045/DUF77 family)
MIEAISPTIPIAPKTINKLYVHGRKPVDRAKPDVFPWEKAIRLVMHRYDPKRKMARLQALAEKTYELAMEGNMAAIKEIGDRLDGKASQRVAMEVKVDEQTLDLLDARDSLLQALKGRTIEIEPETGSEST